MNSSLSTVTSTPTYVQDASSVIRIYIHTAHKIHLLTSFAAGTLLDPGSSIVSVCPSVLLSTTKITMLWHFIPIIANLSSATEA